MTASPDVLTQATPWKWSAAGARGSDSGDLEEVAECPHTHGKPPGADRGCHQNQPPRGRRSLDLST